jgi:hypothetical protein
MFLGHVEIRDDHSEELTVGQTGVPGTCAEQARLLCLRATSLRDVLSQAEIETRHKVYISCLRYPDTPSAPVCSVRFENLDNQAHILDH